MMALRILAAFLLSGCQPASAGAARECPNCNLIVISLSNIGAGRMSLYGYRRKSTPKLDDWAKHAIVFDNAFTHASWTLPVATSLFTAMYPYSHQVLSRGELGKNSLHPGIQTLPEILRDHGYRTAAFTGGLDYYVGFNMMRGFQDAVKNEDMTEFDVTIPQAEAWLAKNSGRSFMLFLHGYDAHCPFNSPAPFKGTFRNSRGKKTSVDPTRCVRGFKNSKDFSALYSGPCPRGKKCPDVQEVRLTPDDVDLLSDRYDDGVLEADALVGRFLRSLSQELLEKTIVVVFSDHGEMFAKHGRFGRAGSGRGTHYDDVLHVPVMIRYPGGQAGKVSGLVQIIDLMPTLLKALGLPVPRTAEGRDLAPLIREGLAVNRYVYSGAFYNYYALISPEGLKRFPYVTGSESIRDLRWKLIRETFYDPVEIKKISSNTRPFVETVKPVVEIVELYDIEHDPDELVDIAKTHRRLTIRLGNELSSWARGTKNSRQPAPTTAVPQELLQKAKERGYWP